MGCCCSTEEENLSQDGEVNERTRLLNDPVSNNYQVTANSIIDVGALECHTLEQREYIERVRTYNQRVNAIPQVKTPSKRHHEVQLLYDTPATERVLSAQPISLADFNMMITASQKVVAAVSQIRVEHKEDLVVPFGIP
ncbi:ragulator complex protein LAMTOR1-like isoform X2 [Portunus trituberculatus]|uniref:Ragulator complex protein LAMTOR1 n=1 Tax=Portunus trituberculatus TaxID=210409 RepID=A0A5B7CD50_PORTR|nr:ragulator complex protein LAMTOR1-like isoform X2 [Portunus trituberculatus]MPC07479.1 Ragulator complex protein LAMTOR1 [Portunus trituberculatus]